MNDDDDFSQILDQITLPADEELWMDDSFPHYLYAAADDDEI